MVKTTVVCDVCQNDCSDNPYGVAIGPMMRPQEHVNMNLCEEHFNLVTSEVFKAIKKIDPNGETA